MMGIVLKLLLLCASVVLSVKPSTARLPCNVGKAEKVRNPLFSGCSVYAACSRKGWSKIPSLPSNVTCLELMRNNISELKPGDFQGLSNLKAISLTRNKISEVKPGVFQGLNALNVLYLQKNKIRNPKPGAFDGLRKLQYLMLNGNKITTLKTRVFRGLKALVRLDLSNNRIRDLNPGAFEGLNSLEWLNLDGNRIAKLKPGVFGGLNLLRELSLWNNEITELESEVFEGLLILKTLKLGGNSLKCSCITARTYEFLMKTRSSLGIRGRCDRSTKLHELEAETICSSCGIPPLVQVQSCRTKVSGESDASKGEFPWHALLMFNNSESKTTGTCGASLVEKGWLLTAAHCIRVNGKLRRPKDIRVLLGLHDRSKTNESHVQPMKVSRINAHPNYDAAQSENDLALLKLSSEANITDYVLPICLPRSSRRAKTVSNSSLGRVAGWGSTPPCNPSGILQKACTRPITRNECNDVAHQTIAPGTMCTRGDGKTAYTGDAGGGLVFFEYSSRRWVIGGVVSGELNVCLGCPKTALYTSVTRNVQRWIDEITGF